MLMQLLVLLWLVIEDHDNLFIMAESVHFLGIGLLIYKLMTKKNAGGAPLFLPPWCHTSLTEPGFESCSHSSTGCPRTYVLAHLGAHARTATEQ